MKNIHSKCPRFPKISNHHFAKKLTQSLDIPLESVSCIGSIEIKGEDQVLVTECNCILQYEPECILLKVGKRLVKMIGQGMYMRTFTNRCVLVEGKIDMIYPNVSCTDALTGGQK